MSFFRSFSSAYEVKELQSGICWLTYRKSTLLSHSHTFLLPRRLVCVFICSPVLLFLSVGASQTGIFGHSRGQTRGGQQRKNLSVLITSLSVFNTSGDLIVVDARKNRYIIRPSRRKWVEREDLRFFVLWLQLSELFDAVRLGFGTIGLISTVTVQVRPLSSLYQSTEVVSYEVPLTPFIFLLLLNDISLLISRRRSALLSSQK